MRLVQEEYTRKYNAKSYISMGGRKDSGWMGREDGWRGEGRWKEGILVWMEGIRGAGYGRQARWMAGRWRGENNK